MRELADPTPALDMVAEQVLKPRMAYLCGTIGELLGLSGRRPPRRAVRVERAGAVSEATVDAGSARRLRWGRRTLARDDRRHGRAHHALLARRACRGFRGPAEAGPYEPDATDDRR